MKTETMYSSMWFMSIVALLVVDVRTGALQDRASLRWNGNYSALTNPPAKRDIRPSQCYACPRTNGTACDASSWSTASCPADRPLCATVASAPDFASSLTCAAAMKVPCSLRNPSNNSFVLTCVCSSNLCNAPFLSELRNELLNFTFTLTNGSANMTQIFFQSSKFTNVTEENLYQAITIEKVTAVPMIGINSSKLTTVVPVPATMDAQSILRDSEKPRADPLKQEPTMPSDDDEDESEGSGAYEESRILNHAVSAPAAPSSFLPANENSANPLYRDLLVTTLFIYIVV